MATLREHLTGKSRAYKLELARKLGVTERTLNRYCDGSRRPTWRIWRQLARETGGEVTPDSFLAQRQVA